jgi:phosphoglycerate dehydrogenase-like enzyme
MKIVVLNECFLDDSQFEELKELGELRVFSDTDNEEKVKNRIKDADIVLADIFLAPITADSLAEAKNLKFIVVNTTGYDTVNPKMLAEKGIIFANTPNFGTDSVAELAIGLMFAVNRKIVLGDKAMRIKPFEVDPGTPNEKIYKGFNLRDKVFGVIGAGSIGTRCGEIASALGMKTIAYSRTPRNSSSLEFKSKEDVLREADVLSVNLILNDETRGFISSEELSLMKPTSILINTARAGLINEADLVDALVNKKIAGAGLDVVTDKASTNPLLKLENVVLTPHLGYLTNESLKNISTRMVQNVRNFVKGNEVDRLN